MFLFEVHVTIDHYSQLLFVSTFQSIDYYYQGNYFTLCLLDLYWKQGLNNSRAFFRKNPKKSQIPITLRMSNLPLYPWIESEKITETYILSFSFKCSD